MTFVDLCGHERYLKTTVFGLTGAVPDFGPRLKLARRALIGFVCSAVSDTVSNSIRVVKVYVQTSKVPIGYAAAVSEVLAARGLGGLLWSGLPAKLLCNGISSIVFSVAWKGLMERYKKATPPKRDDGEDVDAEVSLRERTDELVAQITGEGEEFGAYAAIDPKAAGEEGGSTGAGAQTAIRRLTGSRAPLKVIKPSPDEVADHEARLDTLTKTSENGAVWRR